MSKEDVRHYVKLNIRLHKTGGVNIDESTENIINAVRNSWFFSVNSFWIGLFVGIILGLLAKG